MVARQGEAAESGVVSAETRLLGAVYRRFGKPATYTPPGGAGLPCRVLLASADPASGGALRPIEFGGGLGVAQGAIRLQVRTAEIAQPEAGGVFAVQGGRTFTLGEAPMPHDADGDEWACTVSMEGP